MPGRSAPSREGSGWSAVPYWQKLAHVVLQVNPCQVPRRSTPHANIFSMPKTSWGVVLWGVPSLQGAITLGRGHPMPRGLGLGG